MAENYIPSFTICQSWMTYNIIENENMYIDLSLSHLSICSVLVTLLVHFSIVLFLSHCVLKQNNWEVY